MTAPGFLRRFLAMAALALGLTACATVESPIPAQRQAAIRSVAVVPAVGDRVKLDWVGVTVFGNVEDSARVDWRIDERFASAVTAALRERYEVKPLAFDPSILAEELEPGFFGPKEWPHQRLRRLVGPRQAPVDAFVLVTAALPTHGVLRQANAAGKGIGMFGRSRALLEPEVDIYAAYRIEVVDARDFSVIGSAEGGTVWGNTAHLRPGTGRRTHFKRVDASWWADSWADMTDRQRTQFREVAYRLIDESVGPTLAAAGLLP
jgi:hypothetical protein